MGDVFKQTDPTFSRSGIPSTSCSMLCSRSTSCLNAEVPGSLSTNAWYNVCMSSFHKKSYRRNFMSWRSAVWPRPSREKDPVISTSWIGQATSTQVIPLLVQSSRFFEVLYIGLGEVRRPGQRLKVPTQGHRASSDSRWKTLLTYSAAAGSPACWALGIVSILIQNNSI